MASQFKIPDDVFPSVPESIFKNHFMPGFIAGDREIYLEWLGRITHRIGTKVRVLDDKTGELLFWVPPIMRGPTTRIGGQMNGCLMWADRLIKSGMPEGVVNRKIEEAFSNGEHFPESDPDSAFKAWRDIARRYGYTEIKPDTPVVNADYEEEEVWDD